MKRGILFLLLGGCTITFQRGDTLRKGEMEQVFGYTTGENIEYYVLYGLTGITDIGAGIDMFFFLYAPAGCYPFIHGKQKVFQFNNISLVLYGKAGLPVYSWEPELYYYQWDALLGIKEEELILTCGVGQLYTPLYWYDLWEGFVTPKPIPHFYFSFLFNQKFYIEWNFHPGFRLHTIGVGIRGELK